MDIFGGMKKLWILILGMKGLWIFHGGHNKSGLFLYIIFLGCGVGGGGSFLYILGLCLRPRYRLGFLFFFWGSLNFQIFLGVCLNS